MPSVAFVVGGFPCKDVSFLNKLRVEHKFVVRMAKGKTGSTLAKILEYQRKHGGGNVKMGLYENVVGLASPPKSQSVDGLKFTVHDSNLAATMEALQEVLNQIAFVFQVDPRNFGHPQSRPRLYLPAFHMHFWSFSSVLRRKCTTG